MAPMFPFAKVTPPIWLIESEANICPLINVTPPNDPLVAPVKIPAADIVPVVVTDPATTALLINVTPPRDPLVAPVIRPEAVIDPLINVTPPRAVSYTHLTLPTICSV